MSRKNWTKNEDDILKKYYPQGGKKLVQKYLPDRTLSSIGNRSNVLKIKVNNDGTWTKKEEKILKKYYPSGGVEEVKKYLPNRSKISIQVRSSRLGINLDSWWSKDEIDTLKYWYPLIGYRSSKNREIIGTPKLLDKLPNRTEQSIRNKVNKLGIVINYQRDVKNNNLRCILCLIIKKKTDFNDWTIRDNKSYCKDCERTISLYSYRENYKKRLIKNFRISVEERTGLKVSFEKGQKIIENVLKNNSYNCFFEDEYCSDEGLIGLTVGHKKPVSNSNITQVTDPENLFFLCMLHNSVMSNVPFDELRDCLSSISNKLINPLSTQP